MVQARELFQGEVTMMNGRPTSGCFEFEDARTEPHPLPMDPLIHGRFLSILDKLNLLAMWRRDFAQTFTFSPEELASARRQAEMLDDIAGWSRGRLSPAIDLVVVPYFETTVMTFRFLRARLFGAHETVLTDQPQFRGDGAEGGLRLAAHIRAPRRRLRIELIDLVHGADRRRGATPNAHKDHRSAHAGVLASLAMNLACAQEIDGRVLPFPCLAGYELTVNEVFRWQGQESSAQAWTHAPLIQMDRHFGRLRFGAHPLTKHHDFLSVSRIIRMF